MYPGGIIDGFGEDSRDNPTNPTGGDAATGIEASTAAQMADFSPGADGQGTAARRETHEVAHRAVRRSELRYGTRQACDEYLSKDYLSFHEQWQAGRSCGFPACHCLFQIRQIDKHSLVLSVC